MKSRKDIMKALRAKVKIVNYSTFSDKRQKGQRLKLYHVVHAPNKTAVNIRHHFKSLGYGDVTVEEARSRNGISSIVIFFPFDKYGA